MKVHELKCWPVPYRATLDGSKRHEFRRNDRGFEVGDLLLLREWSPIGTDVWPAEKGDYTGRMAMVRISFISHGPDWGIPTGHVVMSIAQVQLELAR